MSVFSTLIDLVSGEHCRIPLEDVSSEILSAILRQHDGRLLDRFANEVLGVEGTDYQLQTRVQYRLPSHGITIPDMVLQNGRHLIFVENKVKSPEGKGQLIRYRDVLLTVCGQKTPHLRYCTLHLDPKSIPDVDFAQLRWVNIARFLKQHEPGDLAYEFLDFLEEKEIANMNGFNIVDMAAMVRFKKITSVIETCLTDRPVQELRREFGDVKHNGSGMRSAYSNLPEHNRIAVYVENVIDVKEYSELLIAFQFESMTGLAIPVLVTQLYCDRNASVVDQLISRARDSTDFDVFDEPYGILIYREEPIWQFKDPDSQLMAIQDWFIDSIAMFTRFREETKTIPWKRPSA